MSRCRIVRSRVEMFVGMWGLLVMPRRRCLYVCHRLCRTFLYPHRKVLGAMYGVLRLLEVSRGVGRPGFN
jgi:hypothetical protein